MGDKQQISGKVISVSSDTRHNFSKTIKPAISLIAGFGVEGDAHGGKTVKHRSRIAKDPTQPNLRQVHLIHSELFDEVATQGFDVKPGDMGENITTIGIDLLSLPRSTRLHIGSEAIIEITGLRNPCSQIDKFQKGLLKACLDKDDDGHLICKSGVMSIVIKGGTITKNDRIKVMLPEGEHKPLDVV